MKKVILALCSAVVILTCSMLTPLVAQAEERGCTEHMLDQVYERTYTVTLSVHEIFVYDDPTGPVYDTCHVKGEYKDTHPKCSVCGYVDFNYRLTHVQLRYWHDNVACPLHTN